MMGMDWRSSGPQLPGSFMPSCRQGGLHSFLPIHSPTSRLEFIIVLFLFKNYPFIKINRQCDIAEKNSLPISKKTSKTNSRLKYIRRRQFINQAKRKVKQELPFNLGCGRTISSSCLCCPGWGDGASSSQLCQHHVWQSCTLTGDTGIFIPDGKPMYRNELPAVCFFLPCRTFF